MKERERLGGRDGERRALKRGIGGERGSKWREGDSERIREGKRVRRGREGELT